MLVNVNVKKGSRVRQALGRPALHVLACALFLVAFVWPLFNVERPITTFCFLGVAWSASIAVLFAVSRGDGTHDDAGADDDDDTASEEACS